MPKEAKTQAKGRPRNKSADQAIMKAALRELSKSGFRSLSMDTIAASAGVGKMTVYRRWPNKAALVMDAFLVIIGPQTEFPAAPSVLIRIHKQLKLQAKFFTGKHGAIISSLLGEAQFDLDLAEAFWKRWLLPRRVMTQEVLRAGIKSGELNISDVDVATDMLYGPFYYRLMLKNGPLDEAFIEEVFAGWKRAFEK